jgi:hypothetical protein
MLRGTLCTDRLDLVFDVHRAGLFKAQLPFQRLALFERIAQTSRDSRPA